LHEVKLGKLEVELLKHIGKRKGFRVTVTVRARALRNRREAALDRRTTR